MGKKLFYRIGEACRQLDIQPYVLRYWETEFPVLSPRKSKAGQRVYSEEELHLIQRIKQLLYEEGYTIAGAKKKLDLELAAGGVAPPPRKETARGEAEEDEEASPETEANGEERPEVEPMPAAVFDNGAGEEVERLRTGLQEALTQARAILRLLP